jgi:CRISPR-associated protein Cas1
VASEFTEALEAWNLREAWETVEANDGCAGIDGESPAMFAVGAERRLADLRQAVLDGSYRPAGLLRLRIPKDSGGERTLAIPTVRDRVLQTAFCRVLQPVLEPTFEPCSYAYRPGRSIAHALRAIDRLRRQGFGWLLDGDIEDFFDNIAHARLCRALGPHLRDPRSLDLLRGWLTVAGTARGVPQGSPLSPLLSNLYLDPFDEALQRSPYRPIRYSDDFVVLCRTWKEAAAAYELVEALLFGLDLRLAENKTRIASFAQGFRFLGADFDDRGFTAGWLRQPHGQRMARVAPPLPNALQLPRLLETAMNQDTGSSSRDSAAAVRYDDWSDNRDEDETDDAAPDSSPAGGCPASALGGNETGAEAETAEEPLLRTLYIATHGSWLGIAGERFVIRRKDAPEAEETPAAHVDLILLLGYVQVSTQAALFCARRRIPLVYLSANGAFRAWLTGLDGSHVELHYRQAACVNDPDWALAAAKSIVAAKIGNSRVVLERYLRNRPEAEADGERESLRRSFDSAERADSLDRLRGYEGAAALAYFSAWKRLLPPAWKFSARTRRPPADPVNALLSLGYSLLYQNVAALLLAEGLNPLFGFFHPPRDGHAGLASDLMEEFRAVTVDAVVWSLVLNGRMAPGDFTFGERGCRLQRPALRRFLEAFERKMNSRVEHPLSGETLDYRRLVQKQVRLLKQAIQAQADYPAFRVR